jgi:uncharacterized membrane protein YagU involved in acid resistance
MYQLGTFSSLGSVGAGLVGGLIGFLGIMGYRVFLVERKPARGLLSGVNNFLFALGLTIFAGLANGV